LREGTHLDHLFERRVLTSVPYPFRPKIAKVEFR
jgi:hypothetical protein